MGGGTVGAEGRCPSGLQALPGLVPSIPRAAAKLDSNLSTAVARLQQQHAAEQEQQQEVLDIQTEFNEFFMRFLVDNNLPFHLVENETTKAFFNKFIPHLKLPSRYEARYEFNTWCGGDYMTRMKLTPRFFSPLLLRDVVRWWGWYGKQTPVLMEVAQRVFCTPATSAGVERLFSVFKMLWSDKRNRLLMGRMWAMAYVFFNTRALKRDEQPFAPTAAEEEQWEEWMASQPVEAA